MNLKESIFICFVQYKSAINSDVRKYKSKSKCLWNRKIALHKTKRSSHMFNPAKKKATKWYVSYIRLFYWQGNDKNQTSSLTNHRMFLITQWHSPLASRSAWRNAQLLSTLVAMVLNIHGRLRAIIPSVEFRFFWL